MKEPETQQEPNTTDAALREEVQISQVLIQKMNKPIQISPGPALADRQQKSQHKVAFIRFVIHNP